MIGYFKVVDKKTEQIIFYHKYSAINNVQRFALRNNDNVKLLCACNQNQLEMKVSSDLKIYPAEQMVGHMHELNCPKHIHFMPQKL